MEWVEVCRDFVVWGKKAGGGRLRSLRGGTAAGAAGEPCMKLWRQLLWYHV